MRNDQKTATRATLSDAWQAQQKLRDWMHVSGVANYVNRLVSGKDLDDGGHWALYAAEKFVRPLAAARSASVSGLPGQRLTRGLSMASLACGSGHIEASLLVEFGWPISSFHGLEFDAALRKAAAQRFATIPDVGATFDFYDFNSPKEVGRQFDIVFTCHSIHHATDIEGLLRFANGLLRDDGLFIGIDYFGPTRFQVEYEIRPIMAELDRMLPDELKRDLRFDDMPVNRDFAFNRIEDVRSADPSEAIRSSDLRTLLFSNFPVVEIKPMGGTLLRWLLQNRAGNFNPANPCHRSIADLLMWIERTMIADRRIRSDDLFFVLRKNPTMA